MNKKKWITYGVTGVVGLGIIAGGAAAAAQSMDLRTIDDQHISNGTINGTLPGDVVIDPSPSADPSVASSPSAVTPPSAASAPSAASQPSPASKPSPASAPSPVSPPSPVSVNSPDSVASAASN